MRVFLIGNLADSQSITPGSNGLRPKEYSFAYFLEELRNIRDYVLVSRTQEQGNIRKSIACANLIEAQSYYARILPNAIHRGLPHLEKALRKPIDFSDTEAFTKKLFAGLHIPKVQTLPIIYELELELDKDTPLTTVDGEYVLTPDQIEKATVLSVTFDKSHTLPFPKKLSEFPNIPLEDFKERYKAAYAKGCFKNPWSTMKQIINTTDALESMSQVYDYAHEHPKSRTANVLKDMFASYPTNYLDTLPNIQRAIGSLVPLSFIPER